MRCSVDVIILLTFAVLQLKCRPATVLLQIKDVRKVSILMFPGRAHGSVCMFTKTFVFWEWDFRILWVGSRFRQWRKPQALPRSEKALFWSFCSWRPRRYRVSGNNLFWMTRFSEKWQEKILLMKTFWKIFLFLDLHRVKTLLLRQKCRFWRPQILKTSPGKRYFKWKSFS